MMGGVPVMMVPNQGTPERSVNVTIRPVQNGFLVFVTSPTQRNIYIAPNLESTLTMSAAALHAGIEAIIKGSHLEGELSEYPMEVFMEEIRTLYTVKPESEKMMV